VPIESPPAAATPTPGPLSCDVRGTKGAAPRRIVLGETVDVSITLRAACPGATRFEGADVLLVVDRSGSMARDDKIDTAKAVAVRLARAFAGTPHRVGLVTFAAEAQLDAPLSAAGDVASLLADVSAEGTTDVSAALALAHATLRADRRPKAVPIAVVITDGRSDTLYDGDALASDGILLATVAVGIDASRNDLSQIAADTDLAFVASAPGAAAAIHRRLLSTIFGTVAGDWTIDDALGAQVELVEDSPRPVAARSDDMLRWARPILPPGGITLTYRVRPLATGLINTNRFAWANYTDADGARRRHILPIPVVEVIAPTPTPTPTPLPTATATPVPPDIYLPLALTERCRPVTSPVDAVLVLDASSSMLERIADGRTKLEAARTAVGTFLDNLRLSGRDQAAIVAFHSAAVVAAPLTADRGRLDRALVAIATDRQTCLVCGVDAAIGILDAAGHRPDRRALIVLLTDGRSNPRPASEAVARAAAAKAAGVAVFTIGLGSDLDAAALEAIASSPKSFYRTSDAASLEAIYRDIARDLPCPAAQFWGRR
jgi:Mg-chelatase subunit ChlD